MGMKKEWYKLSAEKRMQITNDPRNKLTPIEKANLFADTFNINKPITMSKEEFDKRTKKSKESKFKTEWDANGLPHKVKKVIHWFGRNL
jgi:hypothetical protein